MSFQQERENPVLKTDLKKHWENAENKSYIKGNQLHEHNNTVEELSDVEANFTPTVFRTLDQEVDTVPETTGEWTQQ